MAEHRSDDRGDDEQDDDRERPPRAAVARQAVG
jgi:hypothetical protein